MNITGCYKTNMETPLSRALEYLIRTKKKHGVTQTKVAKHVGISQPYVSDLSKGEKEGTLDVWGKIADFFKMNYSDFYKFGESITPATLSDTTLTPLLRVETDIVNLQEETDKKHQIVIEGFKDKELAVKFNEVLVEIESLDVADFKELYETALIKLNKLREKKGLNITQKNGTDPVPQ